MIDTGVSARFLASMFDVLRRSPSVPVAGHELPAGVWKSLCAVRLSLEAVGEDDRDGEAAVCGPPSFAKPLDRGSRFGGGVEPDAFAVGAEADEAVQGAKFAPEGSLRCVDVAHAVTMVAPKRFSTA